MSEDVHSVPVDDLREHVTETCCWCRPVEDQKAAGLWVHNSMDRREEYERGRKPS